MTFGAETATDPQSERRRPKPVEAAAKPKRVATVRSAVTNGSKAFIDGDGNSPWYRRYKDLLALHIEDLGGEDVLSEAQMSLCRRASTLEVELERLDGQLSLGATIDLDSYSRITNTLRRTLESLGLKRVAKDVTPNPLAAHFSRPPRREG